MSVTDFKVYEYRCDVPRCKSVHEQRNASGQYWEGVPPSWFKVTIIGNRSGDKPLINIRDLLMCSNCSHDVDALATLIKEKGVTQ